MISDDCKNRGLTRFDPAEAICSPLSLVSDSIEHGSTTPDDRIEKKI